MKNFYTTVLLALLLSAPSFTFAQVPVFSSFPSAQTVLLLDFDGHIVNGTSWNGNGPIDCGPSNLNVTQITEVYNRVAEDYRPFNINVTTDEAKYLAAPAAKRMRAILTISNSWYGNNAGGVAFINSFSWGDNTPCFIFTSLLNYNVKNISEATAHEAGHTLGLRHQASYNSNCVKTAEYNSGAGNGQISWAPIMGVGYYKNSTTWFNGPNPYGCTNVQSDVDIITSADNGISFRADDYDETFKNATSQFFYNDKFTVTGTIATSSDKDMFKFTMTGRQSLVMDAMPTNVGKGAVGSNLDIQLQLYNTSKTLIGTYNPSALLSASIDTVLDAGTYYFLVEGVGNEFVPEYGSLGSYSVETSQSPLVILPLHKFELKGLADVDQHKLTWFIEGNETIVHQVLQVSKDGRHFSAVTEPGTSERTYQYKPNTTEALQYRVKVTFENGRQSFSNLIALSHNAIKKPKLFTNFIRNNALMINSPASYSYTIVDNNGRMIAQGKINDGASTLDINEILSSGIYFIHFTNGKTKNVEKFVKE
ncbi:MAG TPA: T9SS type A sorting domain-containing protein [Chitinophagaceae bacterium]|nr:T9SS type A sorting domain-containing protein [Chitinophagaceae bacterium]